MLFPVALEDGGHLRREVEGEGVEVVRFTPHDEDCDFVRDPAEQRRVVRSYQPNANKRYSAIGPFPQNVERRPDRATTRSSQNGGRPRIARLLCDVLNEAKIQCIDPDEGRLDSGARIWNLQDQRHAIRQASRDFFIARNVRLRDWLALTIDELGELIARVGATELNWHQARPHGFFIEAFRDIQDNCLVMFSDDRDPIQVDGAISVFGESVRSTRGPYLVMGLVAKHSADAPEATIIRAYAHPCVSWNKWMLVDSMHERDTLHQILLCRDWLSKKFDVSFDVQKPLWDCGPPVTEESEGREVCIPDFLVAPIAGNAEHPPLEHDLLVVETMGINSDSYRSRKERLKGAFEAISLPGVGARTKLIHFNPFEGESYQDIFWKRLRLGVTVAIPVPRPHLPPRAE